MQFNQLSNFIFAKKYEYQIDEIKLIPIDIIHESEKNHIKSVFQNTKLIISSAFSYNYRWNQVSNDESGYIARYTTANFYKFLSNNLKELVKDIKKTFDIKISNDEFFRIFVNSRLNDKNICKAGNLGFIAKNGLLTTDNNGNMTILGEVLLNLNVEDYTGSDNIDKNFSCINCNLCIDNCPTKALDSKFNKMLCIQYLSQTLDWGNTDKKLIFDKWGKRFYGCSNCVDICPLNKIKTKNSSKDKITGFIGTVFDFNNILYLNKTDYKKRFHGNQLGSNWIDELVFVRNSLMSLQNQNQYQIINEFYKRSKELGFNDLEIKKIRDFINIL